MEKIYCTKIASKLGRTYTDKHGLYDITKELLNITLNKSQQSSDWGLKHLSEEQKQYAALDVLYLHKLKEKLDLMLKLAKKLSKPFEFVRIDFYIGENDLIYFSEFTFTPNAGKQVFTKDVEYMLGKLWD